MAVTPDGAVIPLLGVGRGVETLARHIAERWMPPPAVPRSPRRAGPAGRDRSRSGRRRADGAGRQAGAGPRPGHRGLHHLCPHGRSLPRGSAHPRLGQPLRDGPRPSGLRTGRARSACRGRLVRRSRCLRHGHRRGGGARPVRAIPAWHAVDLAILPGISAAQAAAARVGAPLGHDFCVLSLSDNLKPWSQIERRLEHAALADFVIALYNPSSKARPWQLSQALDLLRRHRAPATPVVLGRDVGRPDERVLVTTLARSDPIRWTCAPW